LGLLLVTNGAFAQEPIVFSDDFDRPDSGTLGNGWIDSGQKGLIESATLKLSG
jgi:hypothetical protein